MKFRHQGGTNTYLFRGVGGQVRVAVGGGGFRDYKGRRTDGRGVRHRGRHCACCACCFMILISTIFWKGRSFIFFLENDLQAARAPSGNGVRQ